MEIKRTRHIAIKNKSVRNGEKSNLHKTVWCEVGLKLAKIGTKNVREEVLNPRLGYAMGRLEQLQNTCTINVIGCRRV